MNGFRFWKTMEQNQRAYTKLNLKMKEKNEIIAIHKIEILLN